MTDQDRGAYMPHMDAPLAFDARRPSDRRPLPMTLIASAGVLALIIGALAVAYRGGVRGSEAPKPVGEPIGAIKTAAAPEAASDTASDKLDVYAAQNVPAQAPTFTRTPEQPIARPAPATAPTGLQVRTVDPVKVRIGEPEAPQTVAASPAPVASPAAKAVVSPTLPPPTPTEKLAAATSRTAITPGAADHPLPKPVVVASAAPRASATVAKTTTSATTVDKPAQAVAKTSVTTDTSTTVARAKPSAAKPAKAELAATTPAKSGAAAVQVGAFSSAELAQKGFADAGKLAGLGGHAKSVEKVSRDGKTFYRATLSGFSDKTAAKAFCASLTAKGGRCLVKS